MTGQTPGQLGIYGFRNRKDTTLRRTLDRALGLGEGARRLGRAGCEGHALAS